MTYEDEKRERFRRIYGAAGAEPYTGVTSGRFRASRPNMEQRARPINGVPILSSQGTVYDISSLPPVEVDHVVCCNPAKALCGAFVAGEAVRFGDPGRSRNPCQECFNRAADGEKCGAAMCPGSDVDG